MSSYGEVSRLRYARLKENLKEITRTVSTPASGYLQQYGGLDFLYEHWWALHTDSKYYALLDLYEVCRKNGGYR
ncbi:MAG: DUF3791 domain-containing protein [Tannerellaceae bacterium]|nr:DUF3791 domain-containing protein [Tannerellaceae bacterium]